MPKESQINENPTSFIHQKEWVSVIRGKEMHVPELEFEMYDSEKHVAYSSKTQFFTKGMRGLYSGDFTCTFFSGLIIPYSSNSVSRLC